jgi:ferric-dicitrate binding protein FerR (iron transport regulator)
VSDTQVRAQKGVITYLEGQVQVKKAGETQWAPAHANMILGENDQIKVPAQSRAELILDNQSVMRLSENTVLTIHKLEEEKTTGKENTRMDLSLGRMWVKVSKLFNPASRSDVKTPTVIAGVQGTIYQLSVAGDQSTTIQVYEGAVNVYNPFPRVLPSVPGAPTQVEKPREIGGPQEVKGPTTVSREEWTQIVLSQFQQITVTGREIPQPVPFQPAKERQNEWNRWNEERDADFKPPARAF